MLGENGVKWERRKSQAETENIEQRSGSNNGEGRS